MEFFDSSPQSIEQLITGQGDEVTPRITRPWTGEDSLVAFLDVGGLFVALGKQTQEDQVGELLNGIHRVVDAARPEDVHELVHLLAESRREKVGAVALT